MVAVVKNMKEEEVSFKPENPLNKLTNDPNEPDTGGCYPEGG